MLLEGLGQLKSPSEKEPASFRPQPTTLPRVPSTYKKIRKSPPPFWSCHMVTDRRGEPSRPNSADARFERFEVYSISVARGFETEPVTNGFVFFMLP
jgi:hypothetical protein